MYVLILNIRWHIETHDFLVNKLKSMFTKMLIGNTLFTELLFFAEMLNWPMAPQPQYGSGWAAQQYIISVVFTERRHSASSHDIATTPSSRRGEQ